MKTLRLAALCTALLGSVASAADVAPVIAPPKRAESLATVKALLAPRDAAAPADLVDPFHSEAFVNAAASAGISAFSGPAGPSAPGGSTSGRTGARTPRDLLTAISDALRPGGFIVLPNGQTSLAFGQKRVKAGGTLTITFEGAEYTLEVVAIDRANFTLRLNNEEYTRPIKK